MLGVCESVCCICYILSTLELRTFCLVLTISKACFSVKTCFNVGTRIGFKSGLGFGVRGLVGMVRVWVRSWVKHYNYESPHTDRSTIVFVCVCV